MANSRENIAGSISEVLELIRFRRQSGLLSVRRIQQGRFEEGEIYFQQGQPTYARASTLAGQEALSWLMSWQQLQYEFVVGAPFPTKSSVTLPVAPPTEPENAPPPAWPAPYSSPSRDSTGEQPVPPAQPTQASRSTNTAEVERRIPRKARQEENVMSLPLTRPQRLVYMLVDGERTIADLSRCTRKSVQEVCRLLSELQEQGLVAL